MGNIRGDLRTLLANSVKKFHFHVDGDTLKTLKPNWGTRLVTWIKSIFKHKKHVAQVEQVAKKILSVVRETSKELSATEAAALKTKLHKMQKSKVYQSAAHILIDAKDALPPINTEIVKIERLIRQQKRGVESLQKRVDTYDREIEQYMEESMIFHTFDLSLKALSSLSSRDLNGDVGLALIDECYEILKESKTHHVFSKRQMGKASPKKHLKNLKKAKHMKQECDELLESAATDWAITSEELERAGDALGMLEVQLNDLKGKKKSGGNL